MDTKSHYLAHFKSFHLNHMTDKHFSGNGQKPTTPGGEEEVVAVGSVAVGGRYDNLIGMFDPKNKEVHVLVSVLA